VGCVVRLGPMLTAYGVAALTFMMLMMMGRVIPADEVCLRKLVLWSD
jgi:hypothetical protein